jgi:hypothetical protein
MKLKNKQLIGDHLISLIKEFKCFSTFYNEKPYSFLGGLNFSKTNVLSRKCFISTYFANLYRKNDFRLDTILNYLFMSLKGNSQNCESCFLKKSHHSIYFYLQGKVIFFGENNSIDHLLFIL